MDAFDAEHLSEVEQPLWLVTVVLSGKPKDTTTLKVNLERFVTTHSFGCSVRFDRDRVELTYWDEAGSLQDAVELALSTWRETRQAMGLSDWTMVGLEVLDQTTMRHRTARGRVTDLMTPGEVRPL